MSHLWKFIFKQSYVAHGKVGEVYIYECEKCKLLGESDYPEDEWLHVRPDEELNCEEFIVKSIMT